MKVKDYLQDLLLMVKLNPKIEEFDVIYSSDDEGNDFKPVIFSPTLMEVVDEKDVNLNVKTDSENPNALCIN
jgi:hypothetical protein